MALNCKIFISLVAGHFFHSPEGTQMPWYWMRETRAGPRDLGRCSFPPGPRIELDPRFYRKIDMFDARFPQGAPGLVQCTHLRVKGDVLFEGDVTIIGDVTITNTNAKQAIIKSNTIVDQDLQL